MTRSQQLDICCHKPRARRTHLHILRSFYHQPHLFKANIIHYGIQLFTFALSDWVRRMKRNKTSFRSFSTDANCYSEPLSCIIQITKNIKILVKIWVFYRILAGNILYTVCTIQNSFGENVTLYTVCIKGLYVPWSR